MKKVLKWIAVFLIVAFFMISIGLFFLVRHLPQIPDDLNLIATKNPTVIYADNGQIVKTLTNRQVISYEEIPQDFIHAMLALEDVHFFKHNGLNKAGLLRALFVNVKRGKISEGGSSITQQLAKNLFFTFDRTWTRKVKEILITLQIEQQFSKTEILEAYINQIDFGSGIFGLEMAAQIYFSKHADELTLPECALLAGIPRSPNRYNPYKKDEFALQRLRFVLKRMFEEHFIDSDQLQFALDKDLVFQRMNPYESHADYYVDYIIRELGKEYGRDAIVYGGVDIFTTMNLKYQYYAKIAIEEGLAKLDKLLDLPPYELAPWQDKLQYPQAAMVVMDPKTGAIKALMGGRDYQRAPFNRAVSNNRMPGSSFKIFTYLAALDKGLVTPKTVLVDEPVSFEIYNQVWEPKNFENNFLGPMTVKWALSHSRNVIAAKLIERVKPEMVIEYAKKMGITSELEPNLSLALGATSVSPVEMATAYSTIANGGVFHDPYSITKLQISDNTIRKDHDLNGKRVIDPQTNYILLNTLQGVIDYGTGKSIKQAGFTRPCAGKTGTTNDYRDAWFIGFTPDLVCAVWVGFDDNRSMRLSSRTGVTGGMAALPIWLNFMQNALENQPYSQFSQPPGIVFEEIDPFTASGPMPGQPKITVALRSGYKDGVNE